MNCFLLAILTLYTNLLNNDIVLTLTAGYTIPVVEVYHSRLVQKVIIVMHYNLRQLVVRPVVLGFNCKAHDALDYKFKYYTRDTSVIGEHLSVFLDKYVLHMCRNYNSKLVSKF